MDGARTPDVVLSVHSASKIYRMGEVDVPALREATLDIYDGEFLIIVGPSGSGKTTLLNLIGGMDRPTSGTVKFLGEGISTATDKCLTLYRRRQVGVVFQFFNLVPSLTAQENVEVAVEIADKPMEAVETLGLVGLEDRADHFPSQLSGGEQQRVRVIVALDERPDGLGVGYRLQARFFTGRKTGMLMVPRFSVLQVPDGAFYVLKVVGGRLVKAPVTLGLRSDLEMEVLSGLSETDVVVATPDSTTKPGAKVKVRQDEGCPPPLKRKDFRR